MNSCLTGELLMKYFKLDLFFFLKFDFDNIVKVKSFNRHDCVDLVL